MNTEKVLTTLYMPKTDISSESYHEMIFKTIWMNAWALLMWE